MGWTNAGGWRGHGWVRAAAGGSVVNNITTEGGVTATGGSTTTGSVAITTGGTNRIIVVVTAINSASLLSISDTAGLTWNLAASQLSPYIYYHWAQAPSTLSSNTITATFNGSCSYWEMIAFAAAGTNYASARDSNVALPNVTNGTTPVSITTSNAADLLMVFSRTATPGTTSGWTRIASASQFLLAEVKAVTATQSALSVSDPGAGSNGMIADALVSA